MSIWHLGTLGYNVLMACSFILLPATQWDPTENGPHHPELVLSSWGGLAIWFAPQDFNSQHCLHLDTPPPPGDALKGYGLMSKPPPRVSALNDAPESPAASVLKAPSDNKGIPKGSLCLWVGGCLGVQGP